MLGCSQFNDFTFLCFKPQDSICFWQVPLVRETPFLFFPLAAYSEDWPTWAWQEQRNLKKKTKNKKTPTTLNAIWPNESFNCHVYGRKKQINLILIFFSLLCPVSLFRWLCLRLLWLPRVCDIDLPSLKIKNSPVERIKVDKILSSVPAASWTPITTKSATLPGNKVTTTSPPCLANPLVMSWYLGETICHCMHVASISHPVFSELAVDVPEHPDLPEPQGWFTVDGLHVSDCLTGLLSIWIMIKGKPVGAWTTYILSDYCLQQPGPLWLRDKMTIQRNLFSSIFNAFLSLPTVMKLFFIFCFCLFWKCHISNTVKS